MKKVLEKIPHSCPLHALFALSVTCCCSWLAMPSPLMKIDNLTELTLPKKPKPEFGPADWWPQPSWWQGITFQQPLTTTKGHRNALTLWCYRKRVTLQWVSSPQKIHKNWICGLNKILTTLGKFCELLRYCLFFPQRATYINFIMSWFQPLSYIRTQSSASSLSKDSN